MKKHPSFSPSDESEFAKYDGRPGSSPYDSGHVPEGHRGGGFGTEPAARGLPLVEETPQAGRDADHYAGHEKGGSGVHKPPDHLAHENYGGTTVHKVHTSVGHHGRGRKPE